MAVICHPSFHAHQLKRWPEDFAGIKLALIRSYTGRLKYGTSAKELGTLNTLEFPNPQIAVKALVKGVIDCGIFEKTTFTALVNDIKQDDARLSKTPAEELPSAAAIISRISVHIGYSQASIENNEDAAAFAKDFDRKLFELLGADELDNIFVRYGLETY
jgi:ABC-type amino acid transport substrate-binding protein